MRLLVDTVDFCRHKPCHTVTTNMHQPADGFYTAGKIRGHTFADIDASLGLSRTLNP